MSNESRPKPFLPLIDGRSCFVATLERVADRQTSLGTVELRHWHLTVIGGAVSALAGPDSTRIDDGTTGSFKAVSSVERVNLGEETVTVIAVDTRQQGHQPAPLSNDGQWDGGEAAGGGLA